MLWKTIAIALALGYLFGSIPVGYIFGRLWRVDVRRVGSGRTGGTNVLRAAGLLPAGLTVLFDALKAMIAVGLARFLFPGELGATLAGIGAVAGHNWPIFLGFRGGAGGITTLTVLITLAPLPGAAVVVASLGALVIWRYASAGTLAIATLTLVATVIDALLGGPPEHILYGVAAGAMVTWALRPNIARLRAGTERKIGLTRNDSPETSEAR